MTQEFGETNIESGLSDRQYMFTGWLNRQNGYRHALQQVEFYQREYDLATDMVNLGPDDLVVDIGCFDGQLFIDAIRNSGVKAQLLGIDPYEEAHRLALSLLDTLDLPDGEVLNVKSLKLANYPPNFSFIKAVIEDLPLRDNSVSILSANFMIYLVDDQPKVLDEIKRVLKPGGLFIVATNGENNMKIRHGIEKLVVAELSRKLGTDLHIPSNPAQPFLLEDAPGILQTAGFRIVDDSIKQGSILPVRRGESYDDYVGAIRSAGESLPLQIHRKDWAEAVDSVTSRVIDDILSAMEKASVTTGARSEPYFGDYVDRQAFICRVAK